MPDFIQYLPAAGVCLLAAVIICLLLRLRKENYYPYSAKLLLTKREYKFYLLLRREADRNHCLICPKVGLKDLLAVTDQKEYMKYFHKISQKHVDFVICDYDLRVLFALELDDSTHDSKEARERDRFKNRAFAAANIPLKRIRDFDEQSIRDLFQDV